MIAFSEKRPLGDRPKNGVPDITTMIVCSSMVFTSSTFLRFMSTISLSKNFGDGAGSKH